MYRHIIRHCETKVKCCAEEIILIKLITEKIHER